MKINVGNDLYLKGRIGWKGLSKDEYLNNSDYRIINGYSLKEGFIDWDIAGYISKERYEESPEIHLEIGDILISKDGTIGKVGIVRELLSPSTVASGIFVLRNTIPHKLCTEYLFQYLNSSNFKNFINRVKADGSTIQHLYQRDLVRLEIEVPDLQIQEKIAKVLSDIDSKIELNNKINSELESIAKLIYDYWFVQFDFPDENGNPYKSSGGKMVYDDKLNREIPQGWINGELQDIANITMGQSPSGESYNEDRNGEVFYQGCTDFGLRFPTNRKFTTQPTRFAKRGDILLSVRAPVGTMNIANEDCCIGRGLAALNSKIGSTTYLDGVLQHMKQIFDLRNASGTTFGSITKGDLFSIPVVIPDKKTLQRFDAVTIPMFEKQNLIGSENQMLEKLRDWLLPMLMNGQVTIKD